MNKYELTVVLNVKLEDEQRAACLLYTSTIRTTGS